MAWHVGITWHNVWGLMLSLTLPGHYWLTLMDHALMLVLGKGVAATVTTALCDGYCMVCTRRGGSPHTVS